MTAIGPPEMDFCGGGTEVARATSGVAGSSLDEFVKVPP